MKCQDYGGKIPYYHHLYIVTGPYIIQYLYYCLGVDSCLILGYFSVLSSFICN